MRVINQALNVGLVFSGDPSTAPSHRTPRQDLTPLHWGGCRPPLPGASGQLGRCALVYMDDSLVHSPILEQYLLDVVEVLESFRRRPGQLYAKSSKCQFSRPSSRSLEMVWQKTSICLLTLGATEPRKNVRGNVSRFNWWAFSAYAAVTRSVGICNRCCLPFSPQIPSIVRFHPLP